MIHTTTIQTPVGELIIGVNDDGVCLLDFQYRKMLPAIMKRVAEKLGMGFTEQDHPLHDEVKRQLAEYFTGDRKEFDLPLIYSGTDFQQKVWNGLLNIPYGTTRTYMQQTLKLGDEKAIRAVARANGENCLGIIVPCHRVVGKNGNLTGYAGGLKAKKWLLEHEAKYIGKTVQQEIF